MAAANSPPRSWKAGQKSKPNPDSKQFKSKADRRKALLRIQQGGAQKVGKVYDDVEKRIKVAEGIAKTAIAIDSAAAVISPINAARKIGTKLAVAGGKAMATKIATHQAAREAVNNAKVGARRVALVKDTERIAKAAQRTKAAGNLANKPGARKAAADKLKANQKAANQADIDAKPKHRNPGTRNKETEVKGPTASTKPKQSGPDTRGSSKTHDSHKAVRKENPQQTKTVFRKGQDKGGIRTDPQRAIGQRSGPSQPATVKKRGSDFTAAENKARRAAAEPARKQNYGITGRQKLKASDASKAAQKANPQGKNFLSQGPKGAKRRDKLKVKRDKKAARKEQSNLQ
jgi:hypothetical protein